MAHTQHAHYADLVYQHNTGSQPPMLSASGTSALSTIPHDMSWHGADNSPPSSTSSSAHSPTMYSLVRRSPEHAELEYPSQQSPPAYLPRHSFPSRQHHELYDSRSSQHEMSIAARQDEGGVGPDRGVTRRRGARQEQVESSIPGYSRHPQPMSYSSRQPSRPSSPAPSGHVVPYSHDGPEHTPSGHSMHSAPSQHPSPTQYSPYTFVPSHSRSASGSATTVSNPRSASPALSVASALTSASSHASAPNSQTFGNVASTETRPTNITPREKNKKQRLYNVDRKKICEFHQDHPQLRQEEIAKQFKVERSTVSKILKEKTKWLSVPEEPTLHIAKQRPTKFPYLECRMLEWIKICTRDKIVMTDNLIRGQAKAFAKEMQWPEEKFKASSGWVENFKHRHGIKRGVWHGNGKLTQAAQAMGNANRGAKITYENMYSSVDNLPAIPESVWTGEYTGPDLTQPQDEVAGPSAHDEEEHDEVAQPVEPEPQYHVRRHPVWQSSDQSGDADRHMHHTQDHAQDHADSPHDQVPVAVDPTLNPHGTVPDDIPGAVAVEVRDDNGQPRIAYIIPDPPVHRPTIDHDVTLLEFETAVDTVLKFIDTQEPEFLTVEQRDVLQMIKEYSFTRAGGTR